MQMWAEEPGLFVPAVEAQHANVLTAWSKEGMWKRAVLSLHRASEWRLHRHCDEAEGEPASVRRSSCTDVRWILIPAGCCLRVGL